jgi:hypothetical protein
MSVASSAELHLPVLVVPLGLQTRLSHMFCKISSQKAVGCREEHDSPFHQLVWHGGACIIMIVRGKVERSERMDEKVIYHTEKSFEWLPNSVTNFDLAGT